MKFTTSSDSIGTSIQSAEPSRTTTVQYSLQQSGDGFEVVRTEAGSLLSGINLALLKTSQQPKIEFFNGTTWTPQWTDAGRPTLVRLSIGARNVIVRP